MADAADLKSAEGNLVRVRIPAPAPHFHAQADTDRLLGVVHAAVGPAHGRRATDRRSGLRRVDEEPRRRPPGRYAVSEAPSPQRAASRSAPVISRPLSRWHVRQTSMWGCTASMTSSWHSLPYPQVRARRRPHRSRAWVASIWVESLGRNFEQALDLLAAAVRDCTDELWEASMWQVPDPGPDCQFLGPDWKPVTDPATRTRFDMVQRRSTPWSVAWHALEVLDYDLNGEFGPWAPPPPFAGIRTGATFRACPRLGRDPRCSGTSTIAASGYATRWPA